MNTSAPITSGNQPPSGILSALDDRNAKSISAIGSISATAAAIGQCQTRIMTKKISTESIIIAIVTAMPYAPASALELPNPTTSAITATNSVQLMNGT